VVKIFFGVIKMAIDQFVLIIRHKFLIVRPKVLRLLAEIDRFLKLV
jgi:hypothetical protein